MPRNPIALTGLTSDPEMYREPSFASTQTGSGTATEGSSPARPEGTLPRPKTWHPATRDYKLKMMVKSFLQANGFMHINEARHSWGRTRTLTKILQQQVSGRCVLLHVVPVFAAGYPLHLAASQNKPAVVKALLLLGARPNVKTRRGLTPEDLAKRSGFEEVLHVLEQAALQQESVLDISHSAASIRV